MGGKICDNIASAKRSAEQKRGTIARISKTLANAQADMKKAKDALAAIERRIKMLEAQQITSEARKRGIEIADIMAAMLTGLLDKATPAKPLDKPNEQDDTDVIYDTDEKTKEEIPNEISDS